VSKTVGSTTTWYIYGLDGELVAEYGAQGVVGSPQKEYGYRGGQMLVVYDSTEVGNKQFQWLVQDHLGSTRMVADLSGSLTGMKRHDYLPFGEELGAGVGIRTAGQGYPPPDDQVRQKFTGYERDGETGLDYAQARMYASAQGRFTSVDPLMASGRTWSPQSWNRYSYTLNRPLSLVDPTGLEDEDPNPQSGRKKKEEEVTIQSKTAEAPKILDVKVKLIDPVKGEVPIGGEFEIKYKYAINDPSTVQDAQKPEDYGSIQPITPTGTFTDVNNVGLVGDPKVVVNQKKETVEVEKTERYVVKRTACGGDSCAINFKVVVKDPVNTDKTVSVRSVNQPTFFDKSPQYIPVRNISKPEKRK
jgi:RHS repeat-associated protein